MGKVEDNKQKKKKALLEAAYDLFTSKGIHDTTISDIVKQAGMAKGTFYLYFSDKYEIRDDLISRQACKIFGNAIACLPDFPYEDVENRILFLIDYILNVLNENKQLLKFISKNLSWGVFQRAVLTPQNANQVHFYQIYLKLLEQSGKKFRDPKLMIYMIVELVNATCHNVILHEEPVKLTQLKEELYPVVLYMIRSQEVVE